MYAYRCVGILCVAHRPLVLTPTAAVAPSLRRRVPLLYRVLLPCPRIHAHSKRDGQPEERAENARAIRIAWADVEFEASVSTVHFNNGERTSEASFHKTLPHDGLGQVRDRHIPPRCVHGFGTRLFALRGL